MTWEFSEGICIELSFSHDREEMAFLFVGNGEF
jgi:hypothetical protein